MNWSKIGLICKPSSEQNWWVSHAMAPTAFLYDPQTIRVFIGCWDNHGISRIGFLDLNASNPCDVLNKSASPVVDIGKDGCFDDNGVFPGHVYSHEGIVYLYYTGFQKLCKIPFTNFCGLALSRDGGNTFEKVSEVPVMDRADEGLFTRAGTSIIYESGLFHAFYSVGSSWYQIAGKERPIYQINYQSSTDGINFKSNGALAVKCDLKVEHGLGRPQIIKIKKKYYLFYTRRTIDFKYRIGVAESYDLNTWKRIDSWLDPIEHGNISEFDSQMVYFPCVLEVNNKLYLFYSGNGYGKGGLGYAVLCLR